MARRRGLRGFMRALVRRVPIVGARRSSAARRGWLLRQMPEGSVCAEIGVWTGDFSAEILRVVKPRRLHLIDPWRGATDDAHSSARYARDQAQMDAIHDGLVERFRREIEAGTVVITRATSEQAARDLPDASMDWVYIDGDHMYEAVRRDIETYSRKVKPGGFVCGDDYVSGGWWQGGVKRAVDESVASGRLDLLVQRARQFVLARPIEPIPSEPHLMRRTIA